MTTATRPEAARRTPAVCGRAAIRYRERTLSDPIGSLTAIPEGQPWLIATIGPAGAGKSSLRRRCWTGPYVSLDENRATLSPCGCTANQSYTDTAVAMGASYASAVLAAGGSVWWDATSTVRADRLMLQVLAAEHRARTTALIVLPPLLTTLARNASRAARACRFCGHARRVPEPIVWEMHANVEQALPNLCGEGWDEIRALALPPYLAPPAAGRRFRKPHRRTKGHR